MSTKMNLRICLAISLFLLGTVSTTLGKIIYVDADANGLNDGSSWENAYPFLQDALADANNSAKPVQIRVAQGIYTPDSNSADPNGTGDREATFQLINGVTLKGGYAGLGQPDPNTHDVELYQTILNGDLNRNDVDVNDPCDLFTDPSRTENSYHVVRGQDNAILDSCIIEHGYADEGDSEWGFGGGMFNLGKTNVIVRNCTFRDNFADAGGGMCNREGSIVLVVNSIFIDNQADWAGAMYNVSGSEVEIINCTFEGNTAVADSYGDGGAMVNQQSHVTLENCLFTDNSADSEGGAMINNVCDPGDVKLINCVFRRNSAGYAGGMQNRHASPTLKNCVFSRNSAVETGGGVENYISCDPSLTNCVFCDNLAGSRGGGMYNYAYSDPTLTNCTFSGNSAGTFGGGISNVVRTYPTITNCIFWGNTDGTPLDEYDQIYGGTPTVTYSCIQDEEDNDDIPFGGSGNGNRDVDPCFADPSYWADANDPNIVVEPNDPNAFWVDGDYHLKSQAGRWEPNSESWVQDDLTSPCIDKGNPSSPIGHEPFPNGGIINMGAYGGTVEASKSYFGKPPCEIIVAGDINGDCEVNFLDFRLMALHWLENNNP